MKRYKLKITYFILLLLPLFASCTDEYGAQYKMWHE